MLRVALTLLSVASLAACGTLTPPSAEPASAQVGRDADIDYAKMGLIDRVARSRGVLVVWINAPRKAVAPATPAGS